MREIPISRRTLPLQPGVSESAIAIRVYPPLFSAVIKDLRRALVTKLDSLRTETDRISSE